MKVARALFTVLVMAFVALLMVFACGYDRESSLLPLLVGGSALILGGIALSTEIFSGFRDIFETNLFRIGDTRKSSEPINAMSFCLMTIWVAILFFLIFFFGFLFSLPGWIFCYIRFYGKQPWHYAFITSLVVWLFLYGFFVQMMDMDLFTGIFLGEKI